MALDHDVSLLEEYVNQKQYIWFHTLDPVDFLIRVDKIDKLKWDLDVDYLKNDINGPMGCS